MNNLRFNMLKLSGFGTGNSILSINNTNDNKSMFVACGNVGKLAMSVDGITWDFVDAAFDGDGIYDVQIAALHTNYPVTGLKVHPLSGIILMTDGNGSIGSPLN